MTYREFIDSREAYFSNGGDYEDWAEFARWADEAEARDIERANLELQEAALETAL